MLPFPSIAKARCLSKSWLARFSPVSTLDDEVTKLDVVTFQKRLQERTTNWSTFFPLALDKDFLCGFDRASQMWVSFPSLSFLPKAFWAASTYHWVEGALLYGMDFKNGTLYVANLLTRSWKRSVDLPPRTRNTSVIYVPISRWESSSETYKVIYLQGERYGDLDPYAAERLNLSFDEWSAQIYEPKLDAWVTKRFGESQILARDHVYLNGVLYMVVSPAPDCLLAPLAINLAEGTLKKLDFSFDNYIEDMESLHLVVCNGKMYMVRMELGNPMCVLEIDVESRRLFLVATAPLALSRGGPGQLGLTGCSL